MIIELGHFALCLALMLGLTLSVVPMWGAAAGRAGWMRLSHPLAISVCGLLSISFLSLVHAYAMSDFSVRNVFENSHTLKPWIYKLSGAWGNHEGSILLWAWMLSAWAFAMAQGAVKLPAALQARALSVMGMIVSGFLLFILLTSNPFLRLSPSPVEGVDLNPILQDPLQAIHPPVLYAGYVGFSVAFCFAIAALVEKKVDAEWASFLRPWVLAAWAFLTCGIALGSTWAYYELGWGGFWFWDPVENASLMPWLAGTALLHSVAALEKRGALKVWTVFLCILVFSLSLVGTFLVRSGVLTSVHAFASDPSRGLFILVLLSLAAGGAFLLYALRAPYIKMGPSFRPVSREAGILLNNVFLFTFLATVFMGTLYPIFMSALDLGSVSVGAPYFTTTLAPLLLPFAFLMGLGPWLAWRETALPTIKKNLVAPVAMTAVLTFAVAVAPLPGRPFTVFMFMAAGWVLFATLCDFYRKTGRLLKLRQMPRAFYGMTLAHAGFALLLMGAVAATGWKSEKILWMESGSHIAFAGKQIVFTGIRPGVGKNYNYERGLFAVQKQSDPQDFTYLTPEKRWYPSQERELSEAALQLVGLDMLYIVMGDRDKDNFQRRVVRLYYHPLIFLLFLGAALMATGAAVAASSRAARAGDA